MFNFRPVRVDDESLDSYADLFHVCFPTAKHLTSKYLKWLYVANPDGQVIGMDALSGETLAAHYACIPARVCIDGREVSALLSLNTATHPDFRGKGLFTKLAEATYDIAARQDYFAVYGVANANSTPGFTRKLGFQLVSPLDARIGFDTQLSIDWDGVIKRAQFRRLWDSAQLGWRVRNPYNPISVVQTNTGHNALYAKTDRKGIVAWGELAGVIQSPVDKAPGILVPRLFLGLVPSGCARTKLSFTIPSRLRPSPLNFILRSLQGSVTLDKDLLSFSFIDFDAY